MQHLDFKGPFRFEVKPVIFDDLENGVGGVYLVCVQSEDGLFRVYYIGQSANMKKRLRDRLKNRLDGLYSGHLVSALQNNIKILVHRSGEGIVYRFTKYFQQAEYNRDFLNALHLFYAEIPESGTENGKNLRCRIETGLANKIEDSGPNILDIGHLTSQNKKRETLRICTENSMIEYLTDQELDY